MKPPNLSRLHNLRMQNDAAGYAMEEMRPRFAALATRHEDGTAPQAIAAHQLFQTPPALAAMIAAHLPPSQRILEPSAGLGRILDALPPCGDVVAVEIAPQCAQVLYAQDRAGVTIRQGDFLTMAPAALGTFDAVAMNPPFTMRADIRHIRHALTFLRPGGTLAALCFDTPSRETALRPLCATWEKIPAGAFRSEGTNVPTVLLTIKQPNP